MLVNEDLTKRTLVHASELDWTPSPIKGVDRRMLFRIGEEKARATSIVRYAPESRFSRHGHPGGEEFLVLEGIFEDESGDFPAGSYVRNPPGTGHAPSSEAGCTILVKLWQFKADDSDRIVRLPGQGKAVELRPGVSASRLLYEAPNEHVYLEDWEAGAEVELAVGSGLELLVLDGSFKDSTDVLDRWTWLRLPDGTLRAKVGPEGAKVWFKAAPLIHADVCAFDQPYGGR